MSSLGVRRARVNGPVAAGLTKQRDVRALSACISALLLGWRPSFLSSPSRASCPFREIYLICPALPAHFSVPRHAYLKGPSGLPRANQTVHGCVTHMPRGGAPGLISDLSVGAGLLPVHRDVWMGNFGTGRPASAAAHHTSPDWPAKLPTALHGETNPFTAPGTRCLVGSGAPRPGKRAHGGEGKDTQGHQATDGRLFLLCFLPIWLEDSAPVRWGNEGRKCGFLAARS
ncbi:hypothetical protein QBC46DRAFT_378042 [Diplogelasinospora grovesii]|uniref:Uncharacterized protein n=1 Tax=Diplogelasinospora grovesii TaxID=303347 RepID=A0AAN6NCJ2_9PEZI|nr:hypothetical protein QBC46DRAFT_378042 [Diplogelasinospora grovesii]